MIPAARWRVATKFVNIAKSYYASIGRDIDIITGLNGSIELVSFWAFPDVIVIPGDGHHPKGERPAGWSNEFMPIRPGSR